MNLATTEQAFFGKLLSLEILCLADCPLNPEEDDNVVCLDAHEMVSGFLDTILFIPASIKRESKLNWRRTRREPTKQSENPDE
ncbi:MAG: hypothetical protein ACYSWZ_15920 [Planctomycetota bacterium]|jgi:hypothetical protein